MKEKFDLQHLRHNELSKYCYPPSRKEEFEEVLQRLQEEERLEEDEIPHCKPARH